MEHGPDATNRFLVEGATSPRFPDDMKEMGLSQRVNTYDLAKIVTNARDGWLSFQAFVAAVASCSVTSSGMS